MRAITFGPARAALACALLMSASCGVTGDSGGGAAHLPVSGSGPFTPLEPDPSLDMINPPFVLTDNGADLDDPWVVDYGDQMALWVTARRGERHRHRARRLVRARARVSAARCKRSCPTRRGRRAPCPALRSSPVIPSCRAASGSSSTRAAARSVGRRRLRSRSGTSGPSRPGRRSSPNGAEEGAELSSPAVVRHRRSCSRLLPRRRRDLGRRSAVGRRCLRHCDDLGRGSTATRARPSAIRCCARPTGRCRSAASPRAQTRRRQGACATICTSRP